MKRVLTKFQVPLLITVALLVILGSLLLTGKSIPAALSQLITGSLGSTNALSGSLREAAPLLILGAAVFLALKAGLFNIGAEGQFLVGACFGSFFVIKVPGPLGVVAGCIAGALAGALWALPAGWIRAYRNGHEVITTIMLNAVAINLTKAIVAGPMKGADQNSPSTSLLAQSSRLTPLFKIGNFEFPQSVVLGIIIIIGLAWWLKKTTAGYELRATGANSTAAEFAGINTRRTMMNAMVVSGAIAGLAGVLQVTQFEGRFYDGFSPGYGFDALGVALLAGGSPLGIFISALFFGILNKGGSSLSILGIDRGITTVILSMVILIFAAVRYSKKKVEG